MMNAIYMAATPLTSFKNWAVTELQAGAAVVVIAVVIYLLIKRKIGELFGYIVLFIFAGLFIFSFDSTKTWLIDLVKGAFGMS